MTKRQLHELRKEVDDLFYILLGKLDSDERQAMKNVLATLDSHIKLMEEE